MYRYTVADKSGRRAALAATTIPLAVGTVISAVASSFWIMMLGRLITGVVGLYPSLGSAWSQPLNLYSEKLVRKLAFKFNLYHSYT